MAQNIIPVTYDPPTAPDDRPQLATGHPEVRKCRMQFHHNNAPIGNFTSVAAKTVSPHGENPPAKALTPDARDGFTPRASDTPETKHIPAPEQTTQTQSSSNHVSKN